MDSQSYSRLLSYVACEVTMPVKKHVYNFATNDQISMSRKILSAAALTAKSQTHDRNLKLQNMLTNLQSQKDAVNTETHENISKRKSFELFEGTEIEKDAFADILSGINCEGNALEKNLNDEIQTLGETEPQLASNRNIGLVNPYSKSEGTVANEDAEINSYITELYSDPLLLCSDSDFKVMFRMTRSTFKVLVEMLVLEDLEPIEDVPLYKKVLIVLWLLGNSGSYSDAAQVFGVSEEAAANCFFDVCSTLYNKSENFIKWPSSDECNEIAARIEENYGFPGVVGVLGCHYFSISIPKESLSRREHFNGNLRTYCVALQIVCDDELVIRDIFPGLPGGVRPAQVLRDSPLCEQLTSKTQPHGLVDPQKHILARSEFPQLTSMLTPYIEKSESLSRDEIEFNLLHENVCSLVDLTFKMLKNRFSTLKLLDPEVATMVLVTSCVLHNICLQNGDTFEA